MREYLDVLKSEFGEASFKTSSFRSNERILLNDPSRLYAVMETLKTKCGFDMLAELTAVDYLHYPGATDRYGVIYGLTNVETGERVWIKAMLNDPDPTIASVTPLWSGGNWLEREVFDLYGITFDGHPDLRRILMPEECTSHPLRKDYPLRGRGERHNFDTILRSES